MQGLGVRYLGRTIDALCDVDECIEPGEVVAITGPSGCGKSTLCRTLAGFVPTMIPAAVRGDLRIGDVTAWHHDAERLAERVGFVQQDADAQICTLRVAQEVAFGPENLCLAPDVVRRRVDDALALVGIEHLRGRETPALSGGEKQRLALASILAMEPSILLLDEPTANLDPQGAARILDLLGRLAHERGLSLVIVEHRLRPILTLQPRLIVLDQGRIVQRHPSRQHWNLEDLGLRERWPDLASGHTTEGGGLCVDGLSFGYDRPLIQDLSLRLNPGEVLGIIGPNGGGKTSLLRILAGLEKPDAGKLDLPKETVRGFAFQHPHHQIFEQTVEREIHLDGPIRDSVMKERLAAARLAGLGHVPPLSLSLGEQRRLTLMTTLSRDPGLLLLDEPFIGQDRRNVLWMLDQIRQARDRGAMVVIVSHDIPLVGALADRMVYLDGHRTTKGSPCTVFESLADQGLPEFTPGGRQ